MTQIGIFGQSVYCIFIQVEAANKIKANQFGREKIGFQTLVGQLRKKEQHQFVKVEP